MSQIDGVHLPAVDGRPTKALERLLAAGVLLVVVLAACDWPSARRDAAGTGFNVLESQILTQNVVGLREDWRGHANSGIFSPVVANGVVFAGSNDATLLYAFDAAGTKGCSGIPNTCAPLWTSALVSGARMVPNVGYLLATLSTRLGWVLLLLVPAALLTVSALGRIWWPKKQVVRVQSSWLHRLTLALLLTGALLAVAYGVTRAMALSTDTEPVQANQFTTAAVFP